MKIKIREATKNDLEQYANLQKNNYKEYSTIIRKKIPFNEKTVKKEFIDAVKKKNRLIIILEVNGKVLSYLISSITENFYGKKDYIDDVFVVKNERGKGYATKLIYEFMKMLKKQKGGTVRLGVDPKNKSAIKLYNKLGFKVTHYDMEKIIR